MCYVSIQRSVKKTIHCLVNATSQNILVLSKAFHYFLLLIHIAMKININVLFQSGTLYIASVFIDGFETYHLTTIFQVDLTWNTYDIDSLACQRSPTSTILTDVDYQLLVY